MESTDAGQVKKARSAYKFAVDALRGADEPTSPKDLADRYGCSGGHMRSVLCDLVDDGEAERIAHGRYIEGPGPESKGPVGETDTSAQDSASAAHSDGIQTDATPALSPGWAVVGATVAVAIVVVVAASTAPTEPVEDDERPDDSSMEGWE